MGGEQVSQGAGAEGVLSGRRRRESSQVVPEEAGVTVRLPPWEATECLWSWQPGAIIPHLGGGYLAEPWA